MSYARDDDSSPPESPKAKGFVTYLYEQVLYELQHLGVPRPTLWRDIRDVERGDQFEPSIEDAIAGSDLFLAVLSRNWLDRTWCRRELESFARRWGREGERALRQRIVVVGKHWVDPGRCPNLLQGQEGYNFFVSDGRGEAGYENEFFERGGIQDPRYFDQVKELARYLWRSATRLDPASSEPSVLPPLTPRRPAKIQSTGRSVNLAKPAADMRQAYHRIIEELQGRGYVVAAAEADIPTDSSSVAFIDAALRSAEVSIHLLGRGAGYIPEGAEPIVKLQLSRAASRVSAAPKDSISGVDRFRRIIWAPRAMLEGAGSPERDPFVVLSQFDRQLETDKVESGALSQFVDSSCNISTGQPQSRKYPMKSALVLESTFITALRTPTTPLSSPKRCRSATLIRCYPLWRVILRHGMLCIDNTFSTAMQSFSAGPMRKRSGRRLLRSSSKAGVSLDGRRSSRVAVL